MRSEGLLKQHRQWILSGTLGIVLSGCGSCLGGMEPPPDLCADFDASPLEVSIFPAWGTAGTEFDITYTARADADLYEAEARLSTGDEWTAVDSTSGISLVFDVAGFYSVRVRGVSDGCGATEWATLGPIEVRGTWTNLGTAPWAPRNTYASVYYDNAFWIFGGVTDAGLSGEVWRSTDGLDWTEITPSGPYWSERYAHEAVVFDDRMWVIGGTQNGVGEVADVWWSTDGSSWTLASAGPHWTPRTSHNVTVFNDQLWLTGGANWVGPENSDYTHFNDVWTSTDGVSWLQITSSAPWAERAQHGVVVYDGQLWILGGVQWDVQQFFNDVWVSADGSVWTEVEAGPRWGPRDGHSAVVFDGRIWVIGGAVSGWDDWDDVWYSVDGVTWSEVATYGSSWLGRRFHETFVIDDQIWLIGGYSSYASGLGRLNELWIGP